MIGGAGHLTDLGKQLGVITKPFPKPENKNIKFEFDRTKVVTTEEEGHLTNFIALADYYFAVVQAWNSYRDTFFGKDLGSGLLLLERALAVVETGVNEVYAAMDSVNVGQAERLIITIGFAKDKNLTVEDLLSWIHSFASREAPALIRDGGLRGVRALIPTATKLKEFTTDFIKVIRPDDRANTPPHYRHRTGTTGTTGKVYNGRRISK